MDANQPDLSAVKTGVGVIRWIFLLIGLFLLGIAGYMYASQAVFIKSSTSAQGTIIKNQRRMSVDSDGYVYAPVVAFTTVDGRTQEFESNVRSDPPAHRVGDTVKVDYDPQDLSNAQIEDPFELYLGVAIVGGIGLIFTIVGMIIFFSLKGMVEEDKPTNPDTPFDKPSKLPW